MASTLLRATLEEVRSVVLGYEGVLRERLGFEVSCCKLHIAIMPRVVGVGCCLESVGSHAAIRALVNNDSHICMAEEGQRVLDRRCVAIALGVGAPKSLMLGYRSPSFLRKFARGFPVLPSVYGQGYCYLWLFVPEARSRAARILGQYPLVGCVVVLWSVLGVWDDSYHVRVDDVGENTFHVTRASEGMTVLQVVGYLVTVLRGEPGARVGGLPEFYPEKVSVGMFSGIVVPRVRGVSVDSRFDGLRKWFLLHGFDLTDRCAKEIWFVTRASMHLSAGEIESKKYLSMAEHVGDRVLSVIVSVRCLSAMVSVANCSVYNEQFKNENLAEKLSTSGLRGVCDVHGLSVVSKANANIFEAVVGVLSTYYSFNELNSFLESIGFRFPAVIDSVISGGHVGLLGLTSLQYKRALELAAEGKI